MEGDSMDAQLEASITDKLRFLYNQPDLIKQIKQLIEDYPIKPREIKLEQPILIAYGDHLYSEDGTPLQTLYRFAHEHLKGLIGAVHLLPFYPYTSDDGFSVLDYRAVNPDLGDWSQIEAFQPNFRLMFDLVLNHCSASSDWFQAFLRDESPYKDYFVTAFPEMDLSAVVRPRTHPLLTPFETAVGTRYVWTTFSPDQVDLNYANPAVLMEMISILLKYVQHGADYIRLDAVAFLWKVEGTSCIHLPQTHVVVRLLRDILNMAAPWVKLITETNVPHEENLSYFGDGYNEAQLVYQFALPPLLLYSFYKEDASILSQWAASLETPSKFTNFFNFSASHDGIGLRPVTNLLPQSAIDELIEAVIKRGGAISYKANSDGSQSAYEMNITYFDALALPDESLSNSVSRFIVSQAIMLALPGLPAIYLPSLFGAVNWYAGVEKTGHARTINREKFELNHLLELLNGGESSYAQVFSRYCKLLSQRAKHAAFQPSVQQTILDLHPSVFALRRAELLLLHNLSGQELILDIPGGEAREDLLSDTICQDIVRLYPYQVMWLGLLEGMY
jgi:glucosylglycerate phosphorylase